MKPQLKQAAASCFLRTANGRPYGNTMRSHKERMALEGINMAFFEEQGSLDGHRAGASPDIVKKEDIPAELEGFKKQYPKVTITMGKTLGADKRLADIIVDRVKEA